MAPKTKQEKTDAISRPPVVVILGHVDHGKTSILDKIRQTKVTEGESGGITQHIGAYQAQHNGKSITFLDTPGHEAFTAIRSRGAKVADIAILVVAAEEGVKPQTKEAIQIIKSTGMPFVVAINKIDKESANPARVRQELAEAEVQVEDYGGTVPVVEMSAKKGDGINELLEMIMLVAELEDLKASPSGPADGVVIESHMDSRRGLVATMIVLEGELSVGDWVVAGNSICKFKLMENFLGKPVRSSFPSQPCLITGWEISPSVGQEFLVVSNREEANKLATEQTQLGPQNLFIKETSTDEQKNNKKIANLIIKADVQSSLEAIEQTLKTIKSDEIDYSVVGYGLGTVSDNDVKKGRATKAAVLGFHVSIDSNAKQIAEREEVRVQTFNIIYELVETVRSIMSDLLDPEIRRTSLGKLKVLGVFKNTGKSQIIGGKVSQGKITRGASIDVLRNNNVIVTGKLGQLQHNKSDTPEVSEGLEAGIRFDAQANVSPQQLIREGDVLDVYEEEKIKRTI